MKMEFEPRMHKSHYYFRDQSAPLPTHPMTVGAVAVIYKDEKVLLEGRRGGAGYAFVGGKLEPNENLLECVQREVLEETNLEGLEFEFYGVFSDPTRLIEYANGEVRRVLTVVFRTSVRDTSILRCSEESESLNFHDLASLNESQIVATHIPIYRALRRGDNFAIE